MRTYGGLQNIYRVNVHSPAGFDAQIVEQKRGRGCLGEDMPVIHVVNLAEEGRGPPRRARGGSASPLAVSVRADGGVLPPGGDSLGVGVVGPPFGGRAGAPAALRPWGNSVVGALFSRGAARPEKSDAFTVTLRA